MTTDKMAVAVDSTVYLFSRSPIIGTAIAIATKESAPDIGLNTDTSIMESSVICIMDATFEFAVVIAE